MKNHFLLIPILAFALSCAKDKTYAPANTTPACLITEIKDSATGQLINTFEYDANRRATKIITYNAGILGIIKSFTYSSNTVSWQNSDANLIPDGPSFSGELNNDGNLKSYNTAQFPVVPGQTWADSNTATYTVDKKVLTLKYRRSIRLGGSNTISSILIYDLACTYTGGRLTKLAVTSGSSNSPPRLAYISEYFYSESYPAVKYNPVLYSVFKELPLVYLGSPMADKIPEKMVVISSGGNAPDTISYSYSATVDTKGFPVKIRTEIRTTSLANPITSTKLYTYTCP